MNYWKLDKQGFVTHYMVSGPKDVPYFNEKKDKNQLRLEAYLRSVAAEHTPVTEFNDIRIGERSRLGEKWKYYYSKGSGFVNVSTFYSVMRKVSFDIATVLIAEKEIDVKAVLWSYAAVDLYCNGICEGIMKQPVYKPIQKLDVTLHLKKGRNLIYLAGEHLGVRDTRSVAGLQIIDCRDELQVTIPDESHAQAIFEAEELLNHAKLEPDRLLFDGKVTEGVLYTYWRYNDDYAKTLLPRKWIAVVGKEIVLKPGEPMVTVRVKAGDTELTRVFERTEQILPTYVSEDELSTEESCEKEYTEDSAKDLVKNSVRDLGEEAIKASEKKQGKDANRDYGKVFEKNKKLIFKRIADVESLSRGEKFGFPISNILARKYVGDTSKDDRRLLWEMLDLIEERYDCSDFLMCGLIRYVRSYPQDIDEEMKARIKDIMLNYRYWMDMDGFDGMCFWSENHALMFYSCAMNAGEMYQDEYFVRAGMTGKDLYIYGRNKVLQWLDDVEEYGFEEFLSTVYMCVTFAALINVVDYSEAEISRRAAAVTDKMLSMLSLHTYKDGIIAPMGRVYRNVLYPFNQGAMALMNLINPKLPYSFGEGWLGFYATSSYRLPEGLIRLMEEPTETSYTTGNARIYLEKTPDYCLTSVASPREPFKRWENETLKADADTSTNIYTKSFNERFHGTTCFVPGTYGYQQHMWYAALDGAAAVFVNHPGSDSEEGDMRPGYWHGNGVMPALKQQHGLLGAIYRIPAEHPLHFTHLYCPECRFGQVKKEDGWIFLQKGRGYLGIWCSVSLEEYDGMNFGCEKRAYADEMAYLCYCGGREDAQSLEEFIEKAKKLSPVYQKEEARLTAAGFELVYEAGEDTTQYL